MSLALEVPVEDRFVGLVRHLAAQAARRAELSEERVDDVKVAVTEIVSNAFEAQRRAGSGDPVRVEIAIDSGFEVAVLDRGPGVDPAIVTGAVPGPAEGLGLIITRSLVDAIDAEARPGGGSRVVLRMARDSEAVVS